MGRDGALRADVDDRVRHLRGHVGERRRQSRRQQIVFDLLGDLYVMPVAGTGGSTSTRLTSGPAFDMQPRFSPDGKTIAFTSDRGGLFNIWVMDADGKNPKPSRGSSGGG
jgi:hypothetical protein